MENRGSRIANVEGAPLVIPTEVETPLASRDPAPAGEDGPWFFSDPAAVALLLAECESWRNTPFRFGSSAKGRTGGTDCVGFCEAVMHAAGVVDRFNFPRTPSDNSRHVHNDKILNFLRGKDPDPQSAVLAAVFAEIPVIHGAGRSDQSAISNQQSAMAFMPGDIALLRTGKGLWHMCVMLGPTAFMQCAFPDGVTEGDISAPNYREHLVAAFRARALPSSILNPPSSSPEPEATP